MDGLAEVVVNLDGWNLCREALEARMKKALGGSEVWRWLQVEA
jgi:hypothetical protein